MTAERVVVSAADGIAAELVSSFRRLGVDVVAVPTDDPAPADGTAGPDREKMRRLAADELGLPTAPFWFAGSLDELVAITEHAGFPLVVTGSAGSVVLLRPEDVEPAWQDAAAPDGGDRVLVEKVVEIDHEVTLLVVRAEDGTLTFCEPIGHHRLDGVLEAWQPQQMSQIAIDAARSIAARVITALGGRGVFGVELLVRGDEVYFSDATAGLPDTGLVTLRSQRLSMFDLQARATLGLPVDAIMVSPAAVEIVRAEAGPTDSVLAAALQVLESDVRVYRQLGAALATGSDVTAARNRVRQISDALRRWWQ